MKILKIGGSFITDKSRYKTANPKHISGIAKAIAQIWQKGTHDLILVHGAGSFGHAVVLKHKINNGIKTDQDRLGYAHTHSSCSELSLMLVDALIKEGVPAISIPPTVITKQKNKRISEFMEGIVFDYLNAGYLPVLYGDMVPDSELGGSVCSGDQIMARLGEKAEFLVFATNVDGVMDEKGKVIPLITKDNFADVSKHLKETKNDVTGAMKGKISELLGLKTVSYIVNADKPERIAAALRKEKTVCTEIRPFK